MNFMQHRSAQTQHARKTHTSSTLKYNASTLFRVDYISRWWCYIVFGAIVESTWVSYMTIKLLTP